MMSVTRQASWVWCGRAGTAICCKASTADNTELAKQQVNPLFMLKSLGFGLLPHKAPVVIVEKPKLFPLLSLFLKCLVC